MEIELKCYATLRSHCPEEGRLDLPSGTTVAQALSRLAMPLDEVKLVFVNGVHRDLDTELKEGDRLGVFPPVGGG